MEIPKDKVLDVLRDKGAEDKVEQAANELPDPVDPEKHADQLQKLGIAPQALLGSSGGKLGLWPPRTGGAAARPPPVRRARPDMPDSRLPPPRPLGKTRARMRSD